MSRSKVKIPEEVKLKEDSKKIPVRINNTMTIYTDDKKKIPSIKKKYAKYMVKEEEKDFYRPVN